MRNLKLTLAYDGTSLFGWQQTNSGPTVEGILQQTLEKILQQKCVLQAASRTDRGVHARGQVVNFITSNEISLGALKKGLNALLPKVIRVLEIEEAEKNFHPTCDAIGKEYHYHITFGQIQLPEKRLYAWHLDSVLDLSKMERAAHYFLGEHDFSSFCNQRKNLNYADKKREITRLEIIKKGNHELQIVIEGNHFLYKMVRNIVGSLVYVGLGKLDPTEIATILASKSRPQAGVTAPSCGLFLIKIHYQMGIGS